MGRMQAKLGLTADVDDRRSPRSPVTCWTCCTPALDWRVLRRPRRRAARGDTGGPSATAVHRSGSDAGVIGCTRLVGGTGCRGGWTAPATRSTSAQSPPRGRPSPPPPPVTEPIRQLLVAVAEAVPERPGLERYWPAPGTSGDTAPSAAPEPPVYQVETRRRLRRWRADQQRDRDDHHERGAPHRRSRLRPRLGHPGEVARSRCGSTGLRSAISTAWTNDHSRSIGLRNVEKYGCRARRPSQQRRDGGELAGQERQDDGDGVQRVIAIIPGDDPGAHQERDRADGHRLQRVDLLVHPHGAQPARVTPAPKVAASPTRRPGPRCARWMNAVSRSAPDADVAQRAVALHGQRAAGRDGEEPDDDDR